jgi:hypothetical protein
VPIFEDRSDVQDVLLDQKPVELYQPRPQPEPQADSTAFTTTSDTIPETTTQQTTGMRLRKLSICKRLSRFRRLACGRKERLCSGNANRGLIQLLANI